MITVQSLTNSFGEMVIAANVIIMRVDGFAMMPNFSFGNAMTTFTGQNIGARRLDRVEEGTKHGTVIAVGVSTAITILLLFFGHYLMRVFTDTPELVDFSVRMLRILAAGYIAVAVTQCLSGVMRCGRYYDAHVDFPDNHSRLASTDCLWARLSHPQRTPSYRQTGIGLYLS